jgi:hypothetical protein
MKKVLLPVLSVLIAIVLLIGSTGMTVIIKSCHTCGISLSTGIFEPVSPAEDDCCSHFATHCSPASDQSLEKTCCTYITEKLKINNYISSEKVSFSVSTATEPPVFISPAYNAPVVYLKPLSYHNKHGGRDLVVSNCQYLI